LEVLRRTGNEIKLVVVTSDKCYENKEWTWGYRENDQLGGKDMYSASKAAVELLVSAYKRSYLDIGSCGLAVATARAGNVIGGGDRSPYRLVPDCIKQWENGKCVELRNPTATRPWQHVLEPLRGYLRLGFELHSNREIRGESFNFGPLSSHCRTVSDLVKELAKPWGKVKWQDNSSDNMFNECNLLSLNCDKAANRLGWYPVLEFEKTVDWTSQWYRLASEGECQMALCRKQISLYMKYLR